MRGFGSLISIVLLGSILWLLAGWLQVPLVPNLDAVIGIFTLFWLYFIVTVPWNMYFQARNVLFEAQVSTGRGITVNPESIRYAERWSRLALWLALGLHLLTATILAAIALSGVGLIGWLGAAAAILLTLLRPGFRAYLHVRERLRRIAGEIEVPREDALELKRRLADAEATLKQLQLNLDPSHDDSLAQGIHQRLQKLETRQTANSDQHTEFAEHVRLELQRVERDAKNTVAQVLGDAAVVGHVRELVRFFKQA